MQRREFLETTLGVGLASLLIGDWANGSQHQNLQVATFRFDVTPPIGHPLCGGWIQPAEIIDDRLEGIGFVITGLDKPIVICAIDWTGLLNQAHISFREALAAAAGTDPERVSIQTVHQHNALMACLETEKLTRDYEGIPHTLDVDFFNECLKQGAAAVAEALTRLQPVTHVASAEAKVEKVASNRRFMDENGRIEFWRASSCTDQKLIDLPEGLIDPMLKTVAFYNGHQRVLTCHYYATHPMSYYGDGRVNSDFVGLARKRRQAETPDCTQIYFTGCSGNVAAGKYNNRTQQAREELTDRIYSAIVESESKLQPEPIQSVGFKSQNMLFHPRTEWSEADLLAVIANRDARESERIIAAMKLTWLRRCLNQIPVVMTALHVNQIRLLHLPGESFIEYQLRIQESFPDQFVATAAYGDDGMWYIPVAEAFPQGGYEVGVAFADPGSDGILRMGSQAVMN